MRDFRAFVREQLGPLALPRRRELTIVDDLAAELEAVYDTLVAGGRSDAEAWQELQRHMPDWSTIRVELLDSEPALVRFAQIHPGSTPSVIARIRALATQGVAADLRSAHRLFARHRGFAASTVLTLALALGANAAIFTVVYSRLLRPLPFPDSDRVVALGDVYPTVSPNDILSNTAPAYLDRLGALHALEAQALFTRWSDTIAIAGVAEEIRGLRATPSLFRVVQVPPALGRAFTNEEGEIGADRKVILSHGLWQRLYGGDSSVVGRDLRLGWTGQAYTIVGVMPRGFSFFDPDVQFWIPLALGPAQKADDARTRYGYYHVGRLRPDTTLEQVQAQMDALNAATFKRFPELGFADLGMYTSVTQLQDALTRSVRRILYLLWTGSAFVLLIGVINVANLTLVRSTDRSREIATQLALGASRLRVTRQVILEGVLLSSIAGIASLAIATWLLRALAPGGLPANAADSRMDITVVSVTVGASIAIGVLIGLIAAAGAKHMNVNQVLSEGGWRGSAGPATRFFRRALVVVQVAASVVLLVGAGVLSISFRNLLMVDPGFDPDNVITATIFPPPSRYPDPRATTRLSERILDAVRQLPGVQGAGLTSNIALSGGPSPATVAPADTESPANNQLILPSVIAVTPGYFEAMRTPLVRGRDFTSEDRESALPVAILDDRLAARFWPNENPLGKGIFRGTTTVRYTVVGIVRNVRFEGMAGQGDTVGTAYFPQAQAPPLGRLRWLAIKTAAEPHSVMRSVRAAVMQIDRDLPLADIQTMGERTSRSLVPQRMAMRLASLFGIVALFLSVLGVYSVLTQVVAQRTREIAIRIALGSTLRGIFRLVFSEGVALITIGLSIGLFGALAVGRALRGELFGVTPTDPKVLSVVIVLTGIVALVACLAPARRATRVDPLIALSEH